MNRREARNPLWVSRLIYPYRVVGMALGGLSVAAVLHELHAPWAAWGFVVLGCLVWPHLAYWRATRSADPLRAEKHHLLIDSAIAGAMVPMMHFNVLPSTLLITLTTVDKLSTGFRRLWLHSLPALILGGVASALLLGTGFNPLTSMPVLLACMPMLLIHMIAVSIGRYQLIRKVTAQNRELDRLRRIDTLTGLSRRGPWEEQAQQVLASRRPGRQDCLLLIDVDRFKQINDQHGHGAGDATLRELAERMRRVMRPHDHVGRRGGDEFAVLLPETTHAEALAIAERLRSEVEQIRLPDYPGVVPTVSIGLAVAPAEPARHDTWLDTWLEHADNALYRAKHEGRNTVMG
ncbi:sensor domain-containing diguanylate cyclase [Novilysobacter antarcticus]|uniref:sensor domain-containing diguanylate cyclase n=1 Tax=Novilysobacter antarcticus TaxID=2862543 RepID=UPI001C9A0490|nr:sensor domain-containing diguanylate cyclase [Lysobacter antarcticus]